MTAAGRGWRRGNVNGDARLYALTLAGTVELHAPIGIHAVARGRKGPRGGARRRARGRERAYALRALNPGAPVPVGRPPSFPKKGRRSPHWAGCAVRAGACRVRCTTAVAGGDDSLLGQLVLGVARARGATRPHFSGAPGSWATPIDSPSRAARATTASSSPTVRAPGRPTATPTARRASARRGRRRCWPSPPTLEGNDLRCLGRAARTRAGSSPAPGGEQRRAPWRRGRRCELPLRTAPKASFAAISPLGRAVGSGCARTARAATTSVRRGRDRSARHQRPAPRPLRAASGPRSKRCRCPASQGRAVRRRDDLVLLAVGREPVAAGAAAHLGRERGAVSELAGRRREGGEAPSGPRRRRASRASTARSGAPSAAARRRRRLPRPRARRRGRGVDRDGEGPAPPLRRRRQGRVVWATSSSRATCAT